MIVIDSGALIEVLLRTAAGTRVEQLIQTHDSFAPDLIDAEVFSYLVRARRHGDITVADFGDRITALADAPIDRMATRELLGVASRFTASVSGYDALYLAAATALDCPLVTTDGKLATTATRQFARTVTHVPVG